MTATRRGRRPISALTHFDPVAGDACVLWCLAIDHAVRTGELDVRAGLTHVDADFWEPLLAEAETVEPSYYAHNNGWVVAALLGAWSAISTTDGLVPGLHAAVAGGGDTDTVAAIAGQLLGAAGKTVLLHCVHAHTRTPTVAAVFGALITGSTPLEALERVVAVLPSARPRASFVQVLAEMTLR